MQRIEPIVALLLDFDGVILCGRYFREALARQFQHPSNSTPANEDLCPKCCAQLQFVLNEVPEAKVVISSSWRLHFTMEQLKAKLSLHGIDGSRIIDRTPLANESQRPRGDDISAFLALHPKVRTFAIVDDNDDMGPHSGRLVQTDYDEGLTNDKAVQLIDKLSNPIQG